MNSNKSSDGSTRLMINSHQPLEGPLAWYEAHIKSEEGLNMMGGLFPGSPFVLVGFNENLGWGFTVNKPDLSDIYRLVINPNNDNQYLLDDEWKDFEVEELKLKIKIFFALKIPEQISVVFNIKYIRLSSPYNLDQTAVDTL